MSDPASAFHDHDHTSCTSDALSRAEGICLQAGARLTPVRRRTLEILLEEHRAMGAYDVLERLSEDGFGSQPPVAYRALEFLVDQGLAHRIRRLNAFTACTTFECDHAPAFFICRTCKAVAEIPATALRSMINEAGAKLGFAVERANVEALGLCPSCQDEAAV
ncbi:Zinc uptake regulation protein [Aliiroseovarius pelagivivens]|uniref:Zinc uptake regulation protein n=1 Tax=Aliiroseovarius pelagivivens TaxID=1639690 RepID=A0A2R8ALK4_9RHOB|nr:Fur family transcriptional regulator [Aliiroseovarius pelagivivens]SPF76777.1 Zinc uptake regulation protein [Aliiroseovarius pelagivivens]